MAGERYCDHGIYVTDSTWCPLCAPQRHVIVDAAPDGACYALHCSCGHVERSGGLHGDMAVKLADALLAMKTHIQGVEGTALG